jgi:hypothetical protein
MSGNVEETKINFFDPSKAEDLYTIDGDENKEILEAKIDPLEWRREIERVEVELYNIDKEIELNKQRGVGGTGSHIEEMEECRRHIELIVELCRDIKETCHQDVRKVFAKVVDVLENDLQFIRKHEHRINEHNAQAITQLNKIT